MVLAQSAATAVSHAIKEGTTLQKVDYVKLRARLLADGQVLENALSTSQYKGIIVDDTDAELAGEWSVSIIISGVIGSYQHDGAAADGKASATFVADLPKPGRYDVQIAYVPNENRATQIPVSVVTANGTEEPYS